MAEWFKAPVLKTDVPNGTVGSNPTSTAISPRSLAVKHLAYIQHRLQIRERHRFESCRGYQVFKRLKALAFSLNCVLRIRFWRLHDSRTSKERFYRAPGSYVSYKDAMAGF